MKLRVFLTFLLPLTFALGCSAGSGTDDCNDGADNDGDGLIDSADPGCAANGDKEAPDPVLTACSDGVDNDGDGLIDTADPGCINADDDDEYNEPISACQDGIDNDGDGLIDFPNDPGCIFTLIDSEEDDCPSGINCPACSNGIDDDGDGLTDYPDDLGCNSAGDTDEFNADPSICGANVLVQLLPANGTVMGIFGGSGVNDLISPDCGGNGEEHVFIFEPTEPVSLVLTTDFAETTVDTVLYVRGECRGIETELGCNDDAGVGVSTMALDRLEPGTYYIVVDTQATSAGGNYRLQVDSFTPEKEACDPAAPTCAPGLFCRRFVENGVTAASETCEKPQCSDGEDSDGDGHFDFPDEPGCLSANDNDETDDCPSGPNCAQCSNGIDDDNDQLTDFGSDPGCSFAADTNEIDECIPGIEVIPLSGDGATGTTSGTSNFQNSCSFSTTAPEDVYFFQLTRNVLSLSFSTIGSSFDTVLSVRLDDCGVQSSEVACADPGTGGEEITLDAPTLGNYYVFVDGAFGSGNYVLDVEAVLAQGSACTPGEPGFICESGFTCRVDSCVVAACNDGISNDADGLIDFPNDPGCTSPSDDSENDNCPAGADCPACGNDIDDDLDSLTDFPADPGCQSAADNLELDECIPGVTVIELPDGGATGTTPPSTAGSNFSPSCHSSTASTEDVYAYRNTRNLASLSFSTVGSAGDTVLSVRETNCGSAASEVDCQQAANGGEVVTVNNPTQNFFYFVFVDGDFTSNINYVLNVSGRIAPGNGCAQGDTQFTCSEGFVCGGGNTCVPTQCNDNINNDGDGFIDFPDDPGCTDLNDNSEADNCPSGAGCPQCGNGVDDDGDSFIDFPSDMGCEAASDNLELDDCIAGVPLLSLSDAGASGITEASGNSDFTPSCHSSSLSSEDEYAYLNSRNLTSLTFSTIGSTGDTVLYVRQGTCGSVTDEIACLNVQNGGEAVTISNPTQDDFYFVFVDGDFASSLSYVLNVSGTLGNGEACSVGNTQFICDAVQGFSCNGTICVPSQCNDGIDNDGDTLIDAFDPGCASLADDNESDDPSPAPQCADAIDNDGDTLIDYPADRGCQRAADNLEESCTDSDPIVLAASTPITGTTTGKTNDFAPSCSSTSAAAEVAHEIFFPGDLASLTVTTNGSSYDTVLYMRAGECSATDLACDDDSGLGLQSQFTSNNVPAGLYYIMVDGFSSSTGSYSLGITGVIKTGEACNAAQISSGMLSCQSGSTCTAGTCQ